MGDEVDIYCDLQSRYDTSPCEPQVDAATELDLLDTCVVPRQPTPVKLKKTAHPNAVKRSLEFSSGKAGSSGENGKQRVSETVCSEKEVARLKNQNSILKHNISTLYATAKHVLASKDKEIAALKRRLDNLIFRRNNKGSANSAGPWNGTRAGVAPIHYVPKIAHEEKADTEAKAEKRKHEMSSGLQQLYALNRLPRSQRVQLADVRQMPGQEPGINERTKQGRDWRGGGSACRTQSFPESTTVQNLARDKCLPSHSGERLRTVEDDRRTTFLKRRRSRSPLESCSRKVARQDHVPRDHNRTSDRDAAMTHELCGSQSAEVRRQKASSSKELSDDGCKASVRPETVSSPKCGSDVRCVANDVRKGHRPLSDSTESAKCSDRQSSNDHFHPRQLSKRPDRERKQAYVLRNNHHSSDGHASTTNKSSCLRLTEVCSQKTSSLKESSDGRCKASTRPETKHGSDVQRVANGVRRNQRSLSPSQVPCTTLRSTVSAMCADLRMSSDRSQLRQSSTSPHRERRLRSSDRKPRRVRRSDGDNAPKEKSGKKHNSRDVRKKADKAARRGGSQERSWRFAELGPAQKDTDGASSGIERDLEDGELVSD